MTLKTQAGGNMEVDHKEIMWKNVGWNGGQCQTLWSTVMNQRALKRQGIWLNNC